MSDHVGPATLPEALREAARTVRRGWCTHVLARTRDGAVLSDSMTDPEAVSWCATGAILRACGQRGATPLDGLALEAVTAVEGWLHSRRQLPDSLIEWNDLDARDGDQVADLFEAVASELEEAE